MTTIKMFYVNIAVWIVCALLCCYVALHSWVGIVLLTLYAIVGGVFAEFFKNSAKEMLEINNELLATHNKLFEDHKELAKKYNELIAGPQRDAHERFIKRLG